MIKHLAQDGIYVDDPEVQQKFTDINVQKLEERLLRKGNSSFFKMNGELKLDNDLMADELTRPADLAFEQTVAFQRKETNSVLADRLNAFKKRYFRLDIIVGKVSFRNYRAIFCQEDKLALQLKEQFKEYESRISLAMIPFYQERQAFIDTEIQQKNREGAKQHDIEFLKTTKDEVDRKLEVERRELQDLATNLYETWTEITDLRTKNKFSSTNVQLKVQKQEVDGHTEFNFNLTHVNPSTKKSDGGSLPGSESSRRNTA